jgi:AMP phosphorylase
MKLKVKDMDIETGGVKVVLLHKHDAALLDLHTLDRIKIKKGNKIQTVVLDIAASSKPIKPGQIGCFDEVVKSLKLKKNETVKIMPAKKPLSIEFIKKKLDGLKLNKNEIDQIVWDIVHNKLNEIELTYFVSACYARELDINETTLLTKAMKSHGDILKLKRYPIMDKHCVGGVAGNRTTPIIVSIIAASGLTMPKTSSRSITSPAGTADTMEVLTNISLSLKDMEKVVKKTNGCLIWGGALNLAPADDKIIQVEKPLRIDAKSQLLASVMAKKASVSATHLLIDIPEGKEAKIPSKRRAKILKKDFENLSRRLGINANVIITDGSEPIGNGIGPSLEARDILYVLKNDHKSPIDLKNKSLRLAGLMLELGGKVKKGNGLKIAKEILESGKAYKKFIEIIKAQGGKEIKPEKIKLAALKHNIRAKRSGKIQTISNRAISKIARIAGAPKDKGAGIYLHKHVNNKVKKGEILFTVYSRSKEKLEYAKSTWDILDGIMIK